MSLCPGRRENGHAEVARQLEHMSLSILKPLKHRKGTSTTDSSIITLIPCSYAVSGGFTLNFIMDNIVCVLRCVCIIKPL